MIRCPHCGSGDWRKLFDCAVDPAWDRYQCLDCQQFFSRYGHPEHRPAFAVLGRECLEQTIAALGLALAYFEHSEPRPGYGAAAAHDKSQIRQALARLQDLKPQE